MLPRTCCHCLGLSDLSSIHCRCLGVWPFQNLPGRLSEGDICRLGVAPFDLPIKASSRRWPPRCRSAEYWRSKWPIASCGDQDGISRSKDFVRPSWRASFQRSDSGTAKLISRASTAVHRADEHHPSPIVRRDRSCKSDQGNEQDTQVRCTTQYASQLRPESFRPTFHDQSHGQRPLAPHSQRAKKRSMPRCKRRWQSNRPR